MKIILFIILTIFFSSCVQAQDEKSNEIKSNVIVKTDLPPIPPNPNEEDNIWNKYKSEESNFEITFPAKAKDVWDDDIKGSSIFETYTNKALYRVTVRKIVADLNGNFPKDLIEELINNPDFRKNSKIISSKDANLENVQGKEIIYKENQRMVFSRFYIVEKKVFELMVNLPEEKYDNNFDKWTNKFFDSFQIINK